jgi:hypothetical protein
VIDGVMVGEGVAVGVALTVAVGLAVALGLGVGVALGAGVAVSTGVELGSGDGTKVFVGDELAVALGFAVGWLTKLHAARMMANRTNLPLRNPLLIKPTNAEEFTRRRPLPQMLCMPLGRPQW